MNINHKQDRHIRHRDISVIQHQHYQQILYLFIIRVGDKGIEAAIFREQYVCLPLGAMLPWRDLELL